MVSITRTPMQPLASPRLSHTALRLPRSRACRIQVLASLKPAMEGGEGRTAVAQRREILKHTMGALLLTATCSPMRATAAEDALEQPSPSSPGILTKAGKFGAILLIADVITGVVLGKSALDIMNRNKDSSSGSSGGWKDALADRILDGSNSSTSGPPEFPLQKSQQEWKSELTQEEFRILRLKGTERARSGEYDKYYPTDGHFKCAGCGNPLYSAASKFDSGCGWPAFDKCYEGGIVTETDSTMGMRRVEIMCGNCGGHLGHVFEGEGFSNTNERHCVNSVSIKFDPDNVDSAEAPVTK